MGSERGVIMCRNGIHENCTCKKGYGTLFRKRFVSGYALVVGCSTTKIALALALAIAIAIAIATATGTCNRRKERLSGYRHKRVLVMRTQNHRACNRRRSCKT